MEVTVCERPAGCGGKFPGYHAEEVIGGLCRGCRKDAAPTRCEQCGKRRWAGAVFVAKRVRVLCRPCRGEYDD